MSKKHTGQRSRILIVSDSHLNPTERSNIIRSIFGSLTARFPDSYDIFQVGLYQTTKVAEPLWEVYPTKSTLSKERHVLDSADFHAQKTFPQVCKEINPDIVVVFDALESIEHLCAPKERREYKLVVVSSIDSVSLLKDVHYLCAADHIVSLTDFGQRILRKTLEDLPDDCSSVIYCPANTEKFHSIPEKLQSEKRVAVLPKDVPANGFFLGCVVENQWKDHAWLAYRVIHFLRTGGYLECLNCRRISLLNWDPLNCQFQREDPLVPETRPGYGFEVCSSCGSSDTKPGAKLDDVFLWIQKPPDNASSPWPARMIEGQFNLSPGTDVVYSDPATAKQGHVAEKLSNVYQLWDALLFLSGGTFFGTPAWEAMCTSIPVVYTDYSSHAEFLNASNAGLSVGGRLLPTPGQRNFYMIANVAQAVAAVLKLYRDRDLRKELGSNGCQFVSQYDRDTQAGRWNSLLNDVLRM